MLKHIVKKTPFEIGYCVLCIIYLLRLHFFNKDTVGLNYYDVLTYKDGEAFTLFGLAIAFVIIGGWRIVNIIKRLSKEYLDEGSQIILIVSIILYIIFFILIFIFINNPILRAMMACYGVAIALYTSLK